MIGIVMAAGLVLGPRPAEVVRPGEEAAYGAWLEAQMRATAGRFADKDCSTAVLQPLMNTALTDVVVQQYPGRTFWLESMRVQGCGTATVQELVVLRLASGWQAILMAPGTSVSGPTLQKDILTNVAQGVAALAKRSDPGCTPDEAVKSFRLVDTEVVGAWTAGKPWTERWTAHLCKADYSVDVAMAPSADGGTDIHVSIPAK